MVPARIWAPLITAFVLFLGIAANSARRRAEPIPRGRSWSVGAYVRTLLRTVVGGYLVFVSIVLVFHVALAGERGAIANALVNGTMLAFVVVPPTFAALSWLERALRR